MAWYNSIGQGMGDTLLFADEKQGYTLADRGTYLSMKDKLPGLAVLLGGETLAENKDKSLLNPYGVLRGQSGEAHRRERGAGAEVRRLDPLARGAEDDRRVTGWTSTDSPSSTLTPRSS